ncbi:MAG: SMC family ATPase [Oscillospiraceae bacterium]|nr:SMC family ATPase [Oscillospiraceae bacterium]
MKLISCYIEKFGGLSKFSLDFSEGVTAVHQENGFGKTTLAEFLRAMFYGFPRKAKTLDKSRRQKYTPWDGGKFGGNLIFEHEGVQYRLERTFGATPRSDTFRLTDLSTNRKSDRFSEEIGLDLFQLDADSFERSTYMPQSHDAVTLTTTGIQAKLGDLVEDANDLGNYDKAVLVLKSRRSSFVPYKGNSGSVAEAASKVTQLQRELDHLEGEKLQLADACEELESLEARLESKREESKLIEQQKELAAAAESRRLLKQQFAGLQLQHQKTKDILSGLDKSYPKGIPNGEALDQLEELVNQRSVLHARQITGQSDLEAEAFLREHEVRFASGVPQMEELDALQQKCEAYNSLTDRMEHLVFSDGEEKQYRTLTMVSNTGMLDEEKLEDLEKQNQLLINRRAALDNLVIPDEDRAQMKLLGEFFDDGVPTEEEIDEQVRNLARSEALRQENARLAVSRKPVPEKPADGGMKFSLILAAVGIIAGVLLLVMGKYAFSGILLGAGVLGILDALTLKKKHDKAMTAWQSRVEADAEIQKILDENEAEAAKLYHQVKAFVGKEPLSEGLANIRRNLENFVALRDKLIVLREKRSAAAEEIERIDAALSRELESLYGKVSDYSKAISDLRLARGQHLDLQRKKEELESQREKLAEEVDALRKELITFGLEEGRFAQSLTAMRRDAEAYVRCQEQVARCQQHKNLHKQEILEAEASIQEKFAGFGLMQQSDLRRQIQQLREDNKTYRDTLAQEERLCHQLAAFRAEHEGVLDMEEPKQELDQEHLRWTANRLGSEMTLLTRSIAEQEHRIAERRKEIDRIPQVRDELEFWQEKRIADQKKADTLDATMDFLTKARDSLTTSYLGPIRESFEKLLHRLMGEDQKIFISPDLDVQLERSGEARELGYFSAGQTDLIVLCMRFALVDALFEGEKPFVILDDPFVNLDDQRTAQALQFLRELGQDRQIIYLTCNSSRSL